MELLRLKAAQHIDSKIITGTPDQACRSQEVEDTLGSKECGDIKNPRTITIANHGSSTLIRNTIGNFHGPQRLQKLVIPWGKATGDNG